MTFLPRFPIGSVILLSVALAGCAAPLSPPQVTPRVAPGIAPRAVPLTLSAGDTARLTLREFARYTGAHIDRAAIGIYAGTSGDSVIFQPLREPPPAARVPLIYVRRIERPTGRRSNAGAGFVAGAGLGAMLGAFSAGTCQSSYVCEPGFESAVGGGAVLGLVFGLVGALIGGVSSEQIWREVPLDSLRRTP